MVSEPIDKGGNCFFILVLILVVMEDGLGEFMFHPLIPYIYVLILVVMEDGLGADKIIPKTKKEYVLILVVMEDGLGVVLGVLQRVYARSS